MSELTAAQRETVEIVEAFIADGTLLAVEPSYATYSELLADQGETYNHENWRPGDILPNARLSYLTRVENLFMLKEDLAFETCVVNGSKWEAVGAIPPPWTWLSGSIREENGS